MKSQLKDTILGDFVSYDTNQFLEHQVRKRILKKNDSRNTLYGDLRKK